MVYLLSKKEYKAAIHRRYTPEEITQQINEACPEWAEWKKNHPQELAEISKCKKQKHSPDTYKQKAYINNIKPYEGKKISSVLYGGK